MAKRKVEVPAVVVAASPPAELPPQITLSLGACADELYRLRERRLALQHDLDELAAEEARYRTHLTAVLESQGLTAATGQIARAGLTQTQIGHVVDWDAFAAHVIATRDFSLLQRRLNDGALREHWDVGEAIPGVEPFLVTKVSLTKTR